MTDPTGKEEEIPEDRLKELLRQAGPIPAGLPPEARARLDRLAKEGAITQTHPWVGARHAVPLRPMGIGLAAGILVGLCAWGILGADRPVAWKGRRDVAPTEVAWRAVSVGEPVFAGADWREVRLADGTAVDLAPGSRLVPLRRRPGLVAKLKEGTAWFDVPPEKGRFSIGVPGGRVEVLGTRFAITVNPKEGTMAARNWAVGSASALVAVAVTYGAVQYVGDTDKASPREVRQGEILEVDRAGKTSLEKMATKEARLQQQERVVAERETLLSAKEKELETREKILAAFEKQALPTEKAASAKGSRREKMLKFMEAMRPQAEMFAKMQIPQEYADLFNEFGLQGDAKASVEEILVQRVVDHADVEFKMFDEKVSEDEILRMQEEIFFKADSELSRHLSGAQRVRMEEYERERRRSQRERGINAEIDRTLQSLQLLPGQAESVRQAFREARFAPGEDEEASVHIGMSDTIPSKMTRDQIRKGRQLFGEMFFEKEIKKGEEHHRRVAERLAPLLTPEQMERLKKQQEIERQMTKQRMEIMDRIMGE